MHTLYSIHYIYIYTRYSSSNKNSSAAWHFRCLHRTKPCVDSSTSSAVRPKIMSLRLQGKDLPPLTTWSFGPGRRVESANRQRYDLLPTACSAVQALWGASRSFTKEFWTGRWGHEVLGTKLNCQSKNCLALSISGSSCRVVLSVLGKPCWSWVGIKNTIYIYKYIDIVCTEDLVPRAQVQGRLGDEAMRLLGLRRLLQLYLMGRILRPLSFSIILENGNWLQTQTAENGQILVISSIV